MIGVHTVKAKWKRIARDYVISIIFWMLLSFLVSWQTHHTVVDALRPTPLRDLFLLFGARYLSVALLTPPLVYIVEYWPIGASAAIQRSLAYVIGYVPFTLAFAVIRWCMLPPWASETQSWAPRTPGAILGLAYGSFVDVPMLYIGILVAAHTYFYFSLTRQQELERLQLRQSLTQSELQALKIQLHPHFLFNTLQGISTLIDVNPSTAQNALRKLSTLLRVALAHSGSDLVELADEFRFLEAYLDLEQLRLGPRLRTDVRIPQHIRKALVPQLILQPLIENAIVHGVACCRDGGWIEVLAMNSSDRLELRVRNSVAGQSERGLGLGIPNVRARLRHLYADDASFEFAIGDDRVACATLLVPVLTGPAVTASGARSLTADQAACAS